jgi:hypothetical protein
MPVVSFPWDAQLVSIRRQAVPNARPHNAADCWSMTEAETATFLHAAQARMYFARLKCTIMVDGVMWVLGFAQGTPYRLDSGGQMTG